MKRLILTASVACATFNATAAPRPPVNGNDLVPPATPLIACDPYFSV